MTNTKVSRTFGFAIILILAGLVILLHQLDMLSPKASDILISWPMLIIAIGALNLLQSHSRLFGYLLVAVGVFFIIPYFIDLNPRDFWKYWPVILIALGIILIFKFGRRSEGFMAKGDVTADTIDELNIFGGSEKIITSQNFSGGKITSIFGGSKIDLTKSKLSQGYGEIEVFYLFGGSSLLVPGDWEVENQVNSIMGGFSDERRTIKDHDPQNPQKLVIKGMVIFGGGDIKSV